MIKQAQWPGTFIVCEGIDGAGKSTLLHALNTHFKDKGYTTLLTREPGDTPLGMHIRELLHTSTVARCPQAEFLLFAADRAQHVQDVIIPALQAGTIIFCDRFTDSSLVYQGYGRNIDRELLQKINTWVTQGIVPTLTFYVRITPAIAQARVHARGNISSFEQESITFFTTLIEGFDTLYANNSRAHILDGTTEPNLLAAQAIERVHACLQ